MLKGTDRMANSVDPDQCNSGQLTEMIFCLDTPSPQEENPWQVSKKSNRSSCHIEDLIMKMQHAAMAAILVDAPKLYFFRLA